MNCFRRCIVAHDAAVIDPNRTIARVRDELQIVRNEQYRDVVVPQLVDALLTLALECFVADREDFIENELKNFLRHTGPSISPFNAWLLLKSLETLDLRVTAASASAARVADWLAEQKKVTRLLYPGRADHPQAAPARRQMSGLGTLVSFELTGEKAGAFRFLNALQLVDISNNLGDAKSLITHPATTTHQRLSPEARAQLGIGDGMVRLSVGLEDPKDIIEDLAQGLAAI